MRRVALLLAMAALLVGTATACGDKDGNDGVATLDNTSNSSDEGEDGDGGDDGDDGDSSMEDQALEFSQCMRENGVPDFPDPEFNEDGGMMLSRSVGPGDVLDHEAEEKAMKACEDKMPRGGGNFSEEDRAEMQDAFLEYAECMREHGIDMPDPDFSGEGGAFRMGVGGDGMDPNDPAFKEADDACHDKLGDVGPQRRAG
jgi:hypothetical protein